MKKVLCLLMVCLIFIGNAFAATVTCNPAYNFPSRPANGEPADATQYLANLDGINGNSNTACDNFSLVPGLTDSNIFTGPNTFSSSGFIVSSITSLNGVTTCNNTFTFATSSSGTYGIANALVPIDFDNTSTASTVVGIQCNRGSSNASDATFGWVEGSSAFKTTTDGSTLADLLIGDGDTTGEAVTYDQVPKLTTTNEYTMVNNFDNPPTSDVAASAANELPRWDQTQTLVSSITAGMCSYSTSAPVGACTEGACHYRFVNGGIVDYVCTSGGGWVQENADTISKTVTYNGPVVISSSGNFTVTGATALNGNTTFAMSLTLDFGGNILTNIADPTAAQHAVSLNYFNTHSPKIFSSAQAQADSSWSTSLFGTADAGSRTIGANTLQVGSVIKYHLDGTYTPDASPSTHVFALKLGSSTITSNTAQAFDSTSGFAQPFWIDGEITVTAIGAMGSCKGTGKISFLSGGTNTAPKEINFGTGSLSGTLDTTTSQTFNITDTITGSGDSGSTQSSVLYLFQ